MKETKWIKRIDADGFIGKRFGRWTILKRMGSNGLRTPLYECQCDCGTIKTVIKTSLTHGRSVSCGCFRLEQFRKKITKHGMLNTKVYRAWGSMIQRCYNPKAKKFEIYGGRGIKMDPAWRKEFKAFYDYIGDPPTPEHTIERKDGNRGYFPGNVIWATYKQQNNNTSRNRFIVYNGKKMTTKQAFFDAQNRSACHKTLTYGAFLGRLDHGVPIEKALNRPVRLKVVKKFGEVTNPNPENNIIGKKFNRLTVIKFSHLDRANRSYFACRCDCGKAKIIQSHSFMSGHTISCGCYHKEKLASPRRSDIIGKKFGNWRVIKYSGGSIYECACACGKRKGVNTSNLTSGKSKSCGCLWKSLNNK